MDRLLLIQLALVSTTLVVVCYFDIRYRRIPNKLVFLVLLSGIGLNYLSHSEAGVMASLLGMLMGFGLMLVLHLVGALGAGDVKLFAAVGAMLGLPLVMPTFVIVVLTGGTLAVASMIYSGTVRATSERVLLIFGGVLSGMGVPRFPVPHDKRLTIPYGVAIMVGSLISLVWHNV
jgi:prepilin peptidase CpaA